MNVFTYQLYGKLAKYIILLNGVAGEPFEDDRLDFTDTKTVVVNKNLYVFKGGSPISACKINNLHSTEHLVKTDLPTFSL